MTREDFIKKITPDAVRATKGTKIFPAVVVARAVIESGDGKGNYGAGPLDRVNNFFGITADKNYKGSKVLVKTWEGKEIPTYGEEKYLGRDNLGRYVYNRYFRAYNAPEDSFRDFVKLVSGGRYKAANNATTPEQQASIISKAGYATAKNAEEVFVSVTKKVSGALSQLKDLVVSNKGTIEKTGLVLTALAIVVALSNRNGRG